MPGMRRVQFDAHTLLTAWQWSPFSLSVIAVLVAVAYWYLQADWRLAARGRRWPAHRTVAFMGGLFAIDLALQSPVATFTGSYFQAHVMQHLLLMIVAPPLLAMGAPSTLLLQTAGKRLKERWLAVLRSKPFALLTFPVAVWALYFGFMFYFFLTSLINTAMHDMAVMDTINVIFLLGGVLYWWPMVGIDPIVHWKMDYGARMANILVGAAPETFIGVAILGERNPIATMYTLASTHAGGGLLWSSTELATMIGFIPIFVQWTRSDERRAARDDARRLREAEAAAGAAGGVPVALSSLPGESPHIPGLRRPRRGVERDAPEPQRSAWEAMWLARYGAVPVEATRDDG